MVGSREVGQGAGEEAVSCAIKPVITCELDAAGKSSELLKKIAPGLKLNCNKKVPATQSLNHF